MLFIIASLVVLFGCLPWVSAARLASKSTWLMAFYLTVSANITLTLCIANSFYWLSQPGTVLAIHAMLGVPGWVFWWREGKPNLWGPFQGWQVKWPARQDLVLAVLAFGVGISYLFALLQIIWLPQNNMDSLSTHLVRIVFWRQNGSLFPWSTFMGNQVWYPINAQLQTYWTFLFLGDDWLVGAVQWLSALVSGLGVFGLAVRLGFTTRQAAFAALIFLSFPLVALQATTTQTDLVTAVFFILAVYFLLAGLQDDRTSLLLFSAISIGLGVGVKKSFFILLPVLAVIALLLLWYFGRRGWKPLVAWSLSVVLGIALFGAYIYVVNWRYLGDPFGSPAYIDTLLAVPDSAQSDSVEPSDLSQTPQAVTSQPEESPINEKILEVAFNAPRLIYQAMDTSGLPRPLDGYAHKVKLRVIRPIFQWVGFEEIEGTRFAAPGHEFSFADKNINEESHAWYGPLSFLLIGPALFWSLWQGLKKRSYLLFLPALALGIFLPLEIIFRPGWDPFQGRYFAPLVALCAPLMAIWFGREQSRGWSEWLISGLAVVVVVVTFLYNPSKPTLGKFADEFHIWTNDNWIFVQTIQRKNDRNVYQMIERNVPADATLGYYIPFFFMEYPLFGENLERRLVPMGLPGLVADLAWQKSMGVEYLLLPDRADIPAPGSEYEVLDSRNGWVLYELVR